MLCTAMAVWSSQRTETLIRSSSPGEPLVSPGGQVVKYRRRAIMCRVTPGPGAERHGEDRALAVDAGDGQVAAHQSTEVAADREAEAGPTVRAPGRGFGLGE